MPARARSPPAGPAAEEPSADTDPALDDLDRELAALEEPLAGDDTLQAVQVFCDTLCPRREACALRATHIHLAKAFQGIEQDFAPQDPEVATLSQAGLLPLVRVFEEERLQCANETRDEHDAAEAQRRLEDEHAAQERARLMPVVQEALREVLGSDATRIRAALGDIPDIKQMLEEVLHKRQAGAIGANAEAEASPGIPVQGKVSPVEDVEAARLMVEFRSRYPDDDAEAARHLLAESGVTLTQASRLSEATLGVHWNKSSLSVWVNTSTMRARTSLNRDRLQQLPPVNP